MGGVKFSFGKIVEAFPGLSAVVACIDSSDGGEKFSIWPEGIDRDCVGANIRADLVFPAMQKKFCLSDALDCVGANGIVDAPAGGDVESSNGAHGMDGGVRADSGDACPPHCVKVETVRLIAGSDIERARLRVVRVIKLHGEDVEIGGEMREGSVLDP